MIEFAYAAISAYQACAAAQQEHLARLTPEQRVLYLARKAEERRKREAQERLDREPEVLLARECIDREGLVGATAECLIAFARELASRRA